METALVQQFLDFFQDYLHLCQLSWPTDDTTESEIRNAFLISKHVEICLDRLQKKNLIHEFLSSLNSTQESSNIILKKCLSDPPKYILSKIIQSNTKINQIDIGFNVFLSLYSEEQLEECLTDIFVESASKVTLLKHLPSHIPKKKVSELRSTILLSELSECEQAEGVLLDMLKNCDQDTIELLVVSALNKDVKHHSVTQMMVSTLSHVMSCRTMEYKTFWSKLFTIDDSQLLQLLLDNSDLFHIMSRALLDCGKLLKEHMSAEYFYIDLSYSTLRNILKKLCQNTHLKDEFFDVVRCSESDIEFWENMIS